MNAVVYCLVDSKGCLISSKDGEYELYLSRGTINPVRWRSVLSKSPIIELFQDALTIIRPKRQLRLTGCGFGKKGGILDKTQGRTLVCTKGKVYIYSGVGNESCFMFQDPEPDSYSIQLFATHYSQAEEVLYVVQDIPLREMKRLIIRDPDGIFHPNSSQANEFLIKLIHKMSSVPLSRPVLKKETLQSMISEILSNAGKNTIQVCYHHWFVNQGMIAAASKSECGIGIKVDMTQLAKLHTSIISDGSATDMASHTTSIPHNMIHYEDVFLEEQHMNAQSAIINKKLTALMADLFAKHMQTGPDLQKLQAERDDKETERLKVRAKIAEEQKQEVQLEKDVKTLSVELDRAQPLLDVIRKEYVQAVTSEAEANSAHNLALQQDEKLAFAAAEATAHRMDTMGKVQTQQKELSTLQSSLDKKRASYETVKQSRVNLDAQYDGLYKEIQQMDRELEQMKNKIQTTISRKDDQDMVASLELLRKLVASVNIIDGFNGQNQIPRREIKTSEFIPTFFMISFFSVFDIILSSFHGFSDIYMMNRSIQTGRDNQILRTASTPVDANTQKQAQTLARELVDWVKSNDTAVGLAAPQTGVNLRVIACALGSETPDGYEIRRVVGMINPYIVEMSDEMCREEEACFSVPGETGVVVRPTWIVLQYLDENFKSQKIKLSGFAARVVMHEIDHLDGVLFVDKLDESPQPIL